MKKSHIAFLIGTLIGGISMPVLAFAQAKKATSAASMSAPTDAQIADAKAKNMVWCNTSSKVYHTSSDKYYGKTKKGQFYTEADAKAAGCRAAGTSAVGKKKTASK